MVGSELCNVHDSLVTHNDNNLWDKHLIFIIRDLSHPHSKKIIQTRGYPQHRDMSKYLIENRLAEIENSFK